MKCEGYRRKGGAFTFGPVKWEQCQDEPKVMLQIEGKAEPLPACMECWKEVKASGATVISAEPITQA
jgi:hypothetical protein